MRISTDDVKVGDLIRLADGTRGEVLRISRNPRSFYWTVTMKDDIGRIGPHRMNSAGSVEVLDNLDIYCPYC